MSTIKSGLVAIASEILEEVKREAEKEIRDAEKKAEELLRKAKEKAEKTRICLLAEAKKKYEMKKRRMKSLTEMEIKNNLLQLKEKLVNEAFDKALVRLKGFVQTDKYYNHLLKLIKEATEKINSDTLLVYVNSKDKEWLIHDNLDKLSNKIGVKLKLGDKTENCIGGCIVKTSDGKISYDNTFEKRLQMLKPILRMRIAKILFEKEE